MRAAVFHIAFVVMTVAMFPDVAVLFDQLAGPWLVYVAGALLSAALLAHARVAPRLPANPAWMVALTALAIAQLATPWVPMVFHSAITLALVAAVVMVLLRLGPRVGSLYDAGLVPGILAFFALTALLSRSIAITASLAAAGLMHPAIARVPPPMANVIAAAFVVAAFVVASGIRHRALQPCPAKAWLGAGLAVFVVAAAAAHFPAAAAYAGHALLAAHVMLFAGAVYLLSHLLPRRAADELA